MGKKVNWEQRFGDIRYVLDVYKFPVSTHQIQNDLRKLGIRMTFGTLWNTLDHMRKTQRVHRILLGKKYYWCTTLPKDGLL